MIYTEGKTVVWKMGADEAREFADDIDDAWPYPDRAHRDAEALRVAADLADAPPDPDAPRFRITVDMDTFR